MIRLKTVITTLALILTINLTAQEVPTSGKKIIEVKESHQGEYLQTVTNEDFTEVVINAIKSRMPKKLSKYGFNDITITEIGKVPVPEGWASKLANLTSNKSVGESMLKTATTYNEICAAVDKMYEPEDTDNVDWKFQVNFIDNTTKERYKLRINMLTYKPLYIIKKSDLVKDYSDM
jgi:hypothetical protein